MTRHQVTIFFAKILQKKMIFIVSLDTRGIIRVSNRGTILISDTEVGLFLYIIQHLMMWH